MESSSGYFLTPSEFFAIVCRKIESKQAKSRPKFRILNKDVPRLEMTLGAIRETGRQEHEAGKAEGEEEGATRISLQRIYQECFLDNPSPSVGDVDLMVEEFVDGLHEQDTETDSTLTSLKGRILPFVKSMEWLHGHNKMLIECGHEIAAGHSMVAFPFLGLPEACISISINKESYNTIVNTTTVLQWCKDPDSRALMEFYAEKNDPQLDQLVDTSGASKEQVGLLKLARENLAKNIKKLMKKSSFNWEKCNASFDAKFQRSRLYDNLAASLVLLPSEISKLEVKGDHVVVVPHTNVTIVAPSQDPLALCFLGKRVLDYKGTSRHISLVPLRLVNCCKDLWKWIPYVTDLSRNEFSVPSNKAEADAIISCFERICTPGPKQKVINLRIPVFVDFHAPLSVEAQDEIARLQELPSCKASFRFMCWYCGANSYERLSKCKQCLLARYCGLECQKQHWKLHKKFCKKMKQA